ncbi:hypothetical protein MYCOZU2_04404 [Mycobacterium intracellulare subsp. chimaera]|uniref:Uncharacterized protein n=1 Tax=Mycobacterium intracellulare subsp. chimaera TaxID=222805 RepID=A0A7U5MNE9_MYCIT|nr:hypothetical protein MYCOZU2_04404 [Mycobacterium intracellulare subsp. chimaera]
MIAFVISVPIYLTLVSYPIVVFEKSDRYVAAAAAVWDAAVWAAALSVVVGVIAGASWLRLLQYGSVAATLHWRSSWSRFTTASRRHGGPPST